MNETTERRLKEPQPVFMSLNRGKRHLRIKLESVDGKQDPFQARNTKTGNIIKLQQRERLMAYALIQIPPPKDLAEGIRISDIIRQEKTPSLPEQSLLDTS